MASPRPRPYRPEDQANLGDFDCCANPDDPQEYEREITEWIRDIPPGTIAREIANGDAEEVYVYEISENNHKRIIAYGVLTTESWKLETGPATSEQKISIIAMLGLHRDFQGRKVGGEETARYSTVILRDIMSKASRRCGPKKAIGLYVHPDNGKAMTLYERNGFQKLTHIQWDSPRFHKTYYGMVLYLPEDT
jgi:GNAT superfamily N-acetyltransferase